MTISGQVSAEPAALALAETQRHEGPTAPAPISSPQSDNKPDIDPHSDAQRNLPTELRARFQDAHVLGAGGMGTVYRAHDTILSRDVAVKLLHPGNPYLDENLFREARSQAKLTHENVCKVYEVGTQGEQRYLVMQLIRGLPLDEAKSKMTLEQKVSIVRTIASALHEVHRHGFIHRDIKPANIMVEAVDDGTYKPYLMDFGLAREVGVQGKTVTGVIAGTPAFMAPEQARGEIRQLDRRTDVYSLGATLYDLLAGKPPFEANDVWSLFYDLQFKEPTHLRTVDKTIPQDIAAIVMRCLEKEPHHRYDSAKALAEDLQRFLDGEDVRKASIFFLLYKKAKRNKVAVFVALACLTTAMAFVGVWVQQRRAAERQATFSRELGEDIKAMELFLRTAHVLPTHDIERDRNIVRARLAKVTTTMNTLGALGLGPGHYALGRGHLGLHEYTRAREHFQKAIDAGYASPDLDYALGLTLGELYRIGLEELKRIENPDRKKARLDQLNTELKQPALTRLNAALASELSSPAYVKGLIALYSEDYEGAKKFAQEAFAHEHWLYEAKKLEADAYFAEGTKFRHDKAYDYEKMKTYFQPAADAFAEATDIGRSDPSVFLAACEFWKQWLASTPLTYEAALPIFTKASATCSQGVRSAPQASDLRVSTVQLFQLWGHKLLFSTGAPASDAERHLKETVTLARQAADVGRDDPMAQYVLGTALLNEMYYEHDRGLDTTAAIDGAIDGLTKAATLDPSFLWAHNEACRAHGYRVRQRSRQGLDIHSAMKEALAACDRASSLDPTWAFPSIGKAQAYLYRALDEVLHGTASDTSFDPIFEQLEETKRRSAKIPALPTMFARMIYHRAAWEAGQGRDPEPLLTKGDAALEEALAANPNSGSTWSNVGLLATVRAHRAALAGQTPMPWVEKARAAFDKVTKTAPWDIDYRVYRANADLIGIAWMMKEGKGAQSMFDEALAPLLALSEQTRHHAEFYLKIAELRALEASWLLSQKKNAGASIAHGFEVVAKALDIHPTMAAALKTRGHLFLLRAKSTDDGPDRQADEKQAKDSLDMAKKANPKLPREPSDELFGIAP